jgi:hypothetical protein
MAGPLRRHGVSRLNLLTAIEINVVSRASELTSPPPCAGIRNGTAPDEASLLQASDSPMNAGPERTPIRTQPP